VLPDSSSTPPERVCGHSSKMSNTAPYHDDQCGTQFVNGDWKQSTIDELQ
jgi:hypothetical protein